MRAFVIFENGEERQTRIKYMDNRIINTGFGIFYIKGKDIFWGVKPSIKLRIQEK